MNLLPLIIKREFISKVRNKSFIVMTFLSPVLMVALMLFVGFLATMKSEPKRIAIHDVSGKFVSDFKSNEDYKFYDLSKLDLQFLRDSIKNETYEGILFFPENKTENNIEYISEESPSVEFIASMEDIINKKVTNINLQKASIDTLALQKAQANIKLKLEKASGEKALKGLNEIKIAIGGAFGYLIMMFIVIYGNMVMRSVIEEKTNQIIEIIISSVKPFTLMLGKIIGTSLAGILQFLIWTIIGFLLVFGLSYFFGVQVEQQPTMAGQLPIGSQPINDFQMYLSEIVNLPIFTLIISFLIYFAGGYFLYSSFYAAIGAAVDSETDSQQFLLPIIMPLILAVYVGFFSVLKDPHGNLAVIFSMIPLTSPIVMLMRIPFGVPLWQIIVSMTLLIATFFFVVWFAAKIYRVGILMYGKKISWKELYKWLKY